MKHLVLIILLTACLGNAFAERYKVLSMNSSHVLANKRPIRVGDTLNDQTIITWSQERQALNVFCLENRRQYLMVAYTLNGNGRSVKEFLLSQQHLSTHDGDGRTPGFHTRMRRLFDTRYALLDSIEISTEGIRFPETSYLLATFTYGDAIVSKRLEQHNGNIIIDRSIFIIDGVKLPPCDLRLDIEYHDDANGSMAFVKGDIELILIPEELE